MKARATGSTSYLQHYLGHICRYVADKDSNAVGLSGGRVRACKVLALHARLERMLFCQDNWDVAHRLTQVVLH